MEDEGKIDLDINKDEATGSFREPEYDEDIMEATIDYLMNNGKSYPWNIITTVSDSHNVPKKEVRKALRYLRVKNNVVPAEPFIGKMKLVTDSQ